MEYVSFVSFYPHVASGPIMYSREFKDCISDKMGRINWENISKGLIILSIGLAKKLLVADKLSGAVNAGYSHINELNAVSALWTVTGFAFQLYFDFSGYCDMALGIALMHNINLPVNFDSPFKSSSLKELWKRWHITLSRFLTDYIYIPLGGNRRGSVRTYINIIIVFLLSGLWHGAGFNYVVWGALNGLLMVLSIWASRPLSKIPSFVRRIGVIVCFVLVFIPFRAQSLESTFTMFKQLLSVEGIDLHPEILAVFSDVFGISLHNGASTIAAWVFLTVAILLTQIPPNAIQLAESNRCKTSGAVLTAVLLVISVLSMAGTTNYVYVNF